jgi:hypothetical protein
MVWSITLRSARMASPVTRDGSTIDYVLKCPIVLAGSQ